MNSRHFIMTSMVFLIEAGKYDLAAHYLIKDVYHSNGSDNGQNGNRPAKETLSGELRQRHEAIRKQYPNRLSLKQMREIAREVYEQVCRVLVSDKFPESLVYNENSGI